MNHFIPEEVVIKLKKLAKRIEQFQTYLDDCGVTPAQARLVFPIAKSGHGYTMQELAEHVGVDKALVSRTIADLESKGIVERDKSADSSEKNYKIILSEKGKLSSWDQFDLHKTELEKWRGKLTFAEMITFIKVLDTLTE